MHLSRAVAFREILRTYKEAWEKRNPDLAVKLFAKDAQYLEDPFDEKPARGLKEIRRYWQEVATKHLNVRVSYRNIYSNEDQSIWGTECTARYTNARTGERITLKGAFFFGLTKEGKKVKKFWEYWHVSGGSPGFTWREVRERAGQLQHA